MQVTFKKLAVADVGIPVLEYGDGHPRIAILNGLHGLERSGAYLAYILSRQLTVERGTIAYIPFANPTSAQAGTRLTPEDGLDLNRVFPGNKKGTLSHLLAGTLFDYLQGFDLVVDIHNFPKMSMPLVGVHFMRGTEEEQMKVLSLLQVFKPDYIWHLNTSLDETNKAGSLVEALLDRGVAAFALEAPDIEFLSGELEEKFVQGVRRIYEKLLNSDFAIRNTDIPIITRSPAIADNPGIFIPSLPIGSEVKLGQKIGCIISPDTFAAVDVLAPIAGPLIFILHKSFVQNGDRVAIIGNRIAL